jgi:bifunctional DNA-binding transcriptional regulator/antitoxin component of YhaV-PrlF toxin-antitoxin module
LQLIASKFKCGHHQSHSTYLHLLPHPSALFAILHFIPLLRAINRQGRVPIFHPLRRVIGLHDGDIVLLAVGRDKLSIGLIKELTHSALARPKQLSLPSQGVPDAIAVADILSLEVFSGPPLAKGTLGVRSQLMKGITERLKPPRSEFKGCLLLLGTHAHLFLSVSMRIKGASSR